MKAVSVIKQASDIRSAVDALHSKVFALGSAEQWRILNAARFHSHCAAVGMEQMELAEGKAHLKKAAAFLDELIISVEQSRRAI